jgi:rare lipoprotein A
VCRLTSTAALAFTLAACASAPPIGPAEDEPAKSEPASAGEGARRAERGVASYYSNKLRGHKTASGERYDPDELTAAHRSLPFGTIVEVRREDGRGVRVRIIDRGPFVKGRVIVLSHRAAEKIGLLRDGVAEVTVSVVE